MPLPQSTIQKGLYAIKVNSWPKVFVSFFIGQALGIYTTGNIEWAALLLGFGFTMFGVIFIVLMNDWGDQKVDTIKRQLFPEGCSPKTIPDQILPAQALLVGGLVAGILAMSCAFIANWLYDWENLLPYALICGAIFAAYTLPPLKLNYRGGGEFLEAFGVAFALPLFSAYLQTGHFEITGWYQILLPYAFLSFSSAIASGLSDEESDKIGGKRTIVNFFGNHSARWWIELSVVIASVLTVLFALLPTSLMPLWSVPIFLFIVIKNYLLMRCMSARVLTNAFKEQKLYKDHLHNAIWWGVTFQGVLMIVLVLIL